MFNFGLIFDYVHADYQGTKLRLIENSISIKVKFLENLIELRKEMPVLTQLIVKHNFLKVLIE